MRRITFSIIVVSPPPPLKAPNSERMTERFKVIIKWTGLMLIKLANGQTSEGPPVKITMHL